MTWLLALTFLAGICVGMVLLATMMWVLAQGDDEDEDLQGRELLADELDNERARSESLLEQLKGAAADRAPHVMVTKGGRALAPEIHGAPPLGSDQEAAARRLYQEVREKVPYRAAPDGIVASFQERMAAAEDLETEHVEAELVELLGPSPHDGLWTLVLMADAGETAISARMTPERLASTVRTLRGSGPGGSCMACGLTPPTPTTDPTGTIQ